MKLPKSKNFAPAAQTYTTLQLLKKELNLFQWLHSAVLEFLFHTELPKYPRAKSLSYSTPSARSPLGYKPDEKHSLDIIEKFLEYYIRLEAPSARRPFIFTKALFGKVDSGVFVSAAEAELLAHAVALPKNNCTLWDQGTKW